MSYQEISVSLWKICWSNPRFCVCLCACPYLYACTLKNACFHVPTYHAQFLCAWERRRHSVNDDYDDGVYLSVEVEKGRWWLNECSVRGCRKRSMSQEERGSEKEGRWGRGVNSSLCGEWEKREKPLAVCLHVRTIPRLIDCICVCACVCLQVGFKKWNSRLPHAII